MLKGILTSFVFKGLYNYVFKVFAIFMLDNNYVYFYAIRILNV